MGTLPPTKLRSHFLTSQELKLTISRFWTDFRILVTQFETLLKMLAPLRSLFICFSFDKQHSMLRVTELSSSAPVVECVVGEGGGVRFDLFVYGAKV